MTSSHQCFKQLFAQNLGVEKKQFVDQLYEKEEKFYKGYIDDPRNTDNAWLEVVAYNYHDSDHLIDEVSIPLVACNSCIICSALYN